MQVIINSKCSSVPESAKPLVSEGSALLNLLSCLGYDSENPPLGDLLRRACQLEGDWLVISPVQWYASHNDALIVAAGAQLELQEQEARLGFDLCAKYLAEDQITLHYYDAETWLLQAPQKHPLKAKPVHQLLNKSLMPELAQLDDTLYWQRFITESQMLFASTPNETPINGLWPWGHGVLDESKPIAICADEAFLSIANILSSKVSLYQPLIQLKEQQILLIADLSVLSPQHQQELNQFTVNWYWNNVAYTSGQRNWFIQLWRKLIHAH